MPENETKNSTWVCVVCDEAFHRFPSQVRNKEAPTCSRTCYAVRQRSMNVGDGNPNFRGGTSLRQPCGCGRQRDPRSSRCSVCAGSSYSVDRSYEDTPDEMRKAIASSTSFAEASRLVKSSRHRLTEFAVADGVDVSHFRPGRGRKIPDSTLFAVGKVRRNSTVKKRALEAGFLKNECSECGLTPEWNGNPLTLEMDHLNGNPSDNRLENLRILCPNCHSQTSTFKGRNSRGTPKPQGREVAGVA